MPASFLFEINGAAVHCRAGGHQRTVLLGELRQLASEAQLRGRSRLRSKQQLASALQRHYAARRILVTWRAHQAQLTDPITLERPEPPIFYYRRKNGSSTAYGARVLIEYLLTSTTLSEPVSNVPFTERELAELDALGAALGLASVRMRKHSRGLELARRLGDAARVVELEVDEMVREICGCIAAPDNGFRTALQLRTSLLPELARSLAELRRYNAESAEQCLAQAIGLLNAQSADQYGLKDWTVAWLYALSNR